MFRVQGIRSCDDSHIVIILTIARYPLMPVVTSHSSALRVQQPVLHSPVTMPISCAAMCSIVAPVQINRLVPSYHVLVSAYHPCGAYKKASSQSDAPTHPCRCTVTLPPNTTSWVRAHIRQSASHITPSPTHSKPSARK